MKDVALKAKVSTATVSRALMNPDKVSHATRNRVEKSGPGSGLFTAAYGRNVKRNESAPFWRLSRISAIPSLAKLFAVSKLRRQITDIWC
ncbi:LacI family DNA-binding transcriptional regulator [Shigella flexneri]